MNRKHGVLAGVLVLAIPLAVVATAFACGSLATLKLNRATATAGAPVKATGGNFNSSPRASTVQVRFNGRNGPILWEGRPNDGGRLTATFDAPAARPGYYAIVATQTGPDGRPAAGTPGRAPLQIKRAAGSSRSAEAVPATPWASPPGGAGSQGAPGGGRALIPVLGLALLATGLLGGALALARSARRRRFDVPQSAS